MGFPFKISKLPQSPLKRGWYNFMSVWHLKNITFSYHDNCLINFDVFIVPHIVEDMHFLMTYFTAEPNYFLYFLCMCSSLLSLSILVGNGELICCRTNNMASPYDDKINGNPIGLLQELCMSRRWPPPNYQTEHEEGLPHERQFTIGCTVFKFKEIG